VPFLSKQLLFRQIVGIIALNKNNYKLNTDMQINTSYMLKVATILWVSQLLLACDTNLFSPHSHPKSGSHSTLDTGRQKQAASPSTWVMTQQTDKRQLSVRFSCTQQPFVGAFQQCTVTIKNADKAILNASVTIDGGMKAHGHGLPTSPKLTATNIPGQYKIEGLKFSMPGDWVIGFKIGLDKIFDQAVFNVSI